MKKDRVLVWVGSFRTKRSHERYLAERYDEDDAPISDFARDMETGFYDHDFVESSHHERPKDVRALLEGHSYADAYAAAVEVAWSKNAASGQPLNAVILAFDEAGIESPRSAIGTDYALHCVGAFPFER